MFLVKVHWLDIRLLTVPRSSYVLRSSFQVNDTVFCTPIHTPDIGATHHCVEKVLLLRIRSNQDLQSNYRIITEAERRTMYSTKENN